MTQMLRANPLAHATDSAFNMRNHGMHPGHHRGFCGCAPAFCSRLRRTYIGIIHLNEACEPVRGISLCHGLPDLVTRDSDRPVAFDLKYPLKGEHGDAAFLLSHQEDHSEPHFLRGFSLYERWCKR